MRTFLAVIGALALILIIGVVGFFIVGWRRMAPLKQEAAIFVDDAIPKIAKNWDGEALLDHAAPEFRTALEGDTLEEIMIGGATMFGPMTNYRGAKCQITRIEFQTESGELAVAECLAGASFARVEGEIRASAVKRGGEWKLFAFFVEAVGEAGPLQRTAHVATVQKLSVLEVSLNRGFIAVSTRGGKTEIGAGVGGVQTVHIDH